MQKTTSKRLFPVLALVLGTLLALVALELLLRAGAVLLRSSSEDRKFGDQRSGSGVRILCVGDSFTEGMGARQGYPEQLQSELERRVGPGRFSVINGGCSGRTSGGVLRHLPDQIEHYRPSLIIVMVGTNNNWSLWEEDLSDLQGFITGVKGTSPNTASKVSLELRQSLEGLRLYRFFEFLWYGVSRRLHRLENSISAVSPEHGCNELRTVREWAASGKYEDAKTLLVALQEHYRDDTTCLVEIANYWNDVFHDFGEAEHILSPLAALHPKDIGIRLRLGELYREVNEFEKAVSEFLAVRSIEPLNPQATDGLLQSYAMMHLEDDVESCYQWFIGHGGKSDVIEFRMADIYRRVNRLSDSIAANKRAIRLNPKGDDAYYQLLAQTYRQYSEKDLEVEKMLATNPLYHQYIQGLLRLSHKQTNLADEGLKGNFSQDEALKRIIVQKDLEAIVRIVTEKGVKIMFSGYPEHVAANEIMASVAAAAGTPYVDNGLTFSRLITEKGRSAFLVPDGHCNDAGYGIVASNLADDVLKIF